MERQPITNHSKNGKRYSTNRSKNGKIKSQKKDELMQQVKLSHREQAIFFFKTLGEIRSTGKS
jgi:hypothetical protein